VEFEELKIKKIPEGFEQIAGKLNNLLTLLEPDVEVKEKRVTPKGSWNQATIKMEATYRKSPYIRLNLGITRWPEDRYFVDATILFNNTVFPAHEEDFQIKFDRDSRLDQWAATHYDEEERSYTCFNFSLGDQVDMDPTKAANLIKKYFKTAMDYLKPSVQH